MKISIYIKWAGTWKLVLQMISKNFIDNFEEEKKIRI